MSDLASSKCEACSADAPQLTDAELRDYQSDIPDWELIELDGEKQLKRVFKFDDFAGAVKFANKVADLAEEHDHHPAILIEWGKTTVRWWTHKIGGLHKNDVVMASKTDKLPS